MGRKSERRLFDDNPEKWDRRVSQNSEGLTDGNGPSCQEMLKLWQLGRAMFEESPRQGCEFRSL